MRYIFKSLDCDKLDIDIQKKKQEEKKTEDTHHHHHHHHHHDAPNSNDN